MFSGFFTGGDIQINCKVGRKGYALKNNNTYTCYLILKKKVMGESIPNIPHPHENVHDFTYDNIDTKLHV